jgi:hypothetical protein
MNSSFDRVSDGKDEWLTPKYITDFFDADLDPCSPNDRRLWDTAKKHIGLPQCGLSSDWNGFVFCNPPYGKETYKWLEKCHQHGNAIGLTFARTETRMFFESVWDKATAVLFIKGRLKFYHVTGEQGDSAGAPSVLIAYGEENAELLKNSGIAGKYLRCAS